MTKVTPLGWCKSPPLHHPVWVHFAIMTAHYPLFKHFLYSFLLCMLCLFITDFSSVIYFILQTLWKCTEPECVSLSAWAPSASDSLSSLLLLCGCVKRATTFQNYSSVPLTRFLCQCGNIQGACFFQPEKLKSAGNATIFCSRPLSFQSMLSV